MTHDENMSRFAVVVVDALHVVRHALCADVSKHIWKRSWSHVLWHRLIDTRSAGLLPLLPLLPLVPLLPLDPLVPLEPLELLLPPVDMPPPQAICILSHAVLLMQSIWY